jgi:hypothetical protein
VNRLDTDYCRVHIASPEHRLAEELFRRAHVSINNLSFSWMRLNARHHRRTLGGHLRTASCNERDLAGHNGCVYYWLVSRLMYLMSPHHFVPGSAAVKPGRSGPGRRPAGPLRPGGSGRPARASSGHRGISKVCRPGEVVRVASWRSGMFVHEQ